jgi:hypothetical protein
MSESHSIAPACPGKSTKPYPEFYLFPHVASVWVKKIRAGCITSVRGTTPTLL